MSDVIEMILPMNIYSRRDGRPAPEDGERQRQTVIRAAKEAFGSDVPVTSRQIDVGRGADAGALLVQIVELAAVGFTVLIGPAEIVKRGRDAIEEYRGWARTARSFVQRLRESEDPPAVLSANLATMVAIAELDERAGPVTRLLWWDEIVVQPFEWVAMRLGSTGQRSASISMSSKPSALAGTS